MSFASAGPQVSGKFLEVDGRRFLIKGVTYGTFAPDAEGVQFPALKQIDRDFRMMAEAGINTVRVYTVPEPSLLDAALRHGLRVMIGVPGRSTSRFWVSRDSRARFGSRPRPPFARSPRIRQPCCSRWGTRFRRRSSGGMARLALSAFFRICTTRASRRRRRA